MAGEASGAARPGRGKAAARSKEDVIAGRHLSPALRSLSADRLKLSWLNGQRAQIYAQLWRPIADGRMKTGARLTEQGLEKLFGCSRTLTRSVLEHLEAEGFLTIPPYRSAQVVRPSPREARAVFDILGGVMPDIIRRLAAPSRTMTTAERRLIDMHLAAQQAADKAGEPIAAHLLGIEFLILLAVIDGSTLITDLVGRTVVLETLALKAWGEFPPPAWYVEFQRALASAILEHRTKDAVAEFERRLAHVQGTMRLNGSLRYEEDDIAALIAGQQP